ncbi:extracellular superoxide dismutase [Cu-Zn] [Pelodytes ibericus]
MCYKVLLTVISVLFTVIVRAEVGKTCEEESIADMHQKVKDLWSTLLHVNPFLANPDGASYATCNLKPSIKLEDTDLKIHGQVLFKQVYPNGYLEAIYTIQGFPMDNNQTTRAIHIHNFGDLSDGCDSAGGHYNPFSVPHPNHPGDFGNFRVKDGNILKHVVNLEATLFGPYSIIGRSVVVHMLADDLGKGNNPASLENGNAGKRLACCVIGLSSKNNWEKTIAMVAELKISRVSRRANNKKSAVKAQ